MANGIEIDASGWLHDVERELGLMGVRAKAGVERIAGDAKNRAQQLVRVDTGKLRDSLHTETGSDGEGFYVDVVTDVPYAEEQEYGTSTMTPQPFMRPAIAEAGGRQDFDQVVDRGR